MNSKYIRITNKNINLFYSDEKKLNIFYFNPFRLTVPFRRYPIQ